MGKMASGNSQWDRATTTAPGVKIKLWIGVSIRPAPSNAELRIPFVPRIVFQAYTLAR